MTFFRAEDANQNHILWVSILHTTIYIFTYRVNVLISNTIYRWIRYKKKKDIFVAQLSTVCVFVPSMFIYIWILKKSNENGKQKNRKILAPFLYYNLPPLLLFFGNFEERNETKTKRKNQQKNGKIYYTQLLLVNNYEKFYLFLLPTLRSTLYLYIYQLIFCYYTH